MFPDIGGVELIIVAVVALLVVKPKDLPVMMRKVGEFMGKARRMAADFRASFEDMARQSELDDLRKQVDEMRSKASDPMGINTALKETEQEIAASFSDPDFNYGDAQTEYVALADEFPPAVAEEPATAPKKRAVPKKAASAPVKKASAPKAAAPKAAAPKGVGRKPAAPPTVAEANPKRARAKGAAKTVS